MATKNDYLNSLVDPRNSDAILNPKRIQTAGYGGTVYDDITAPAAPNFPEDDSTKTRYYIKLPFVPHANTGTYPLLLKYYSGGLWISMTPTSGAPADGQFYLAPSTSRRPDFVEINVAQAGLAIACDGYAIASTMPEWYLRINGVPKSDNINTGPYGHIEGKANSNTGDSGHVEGNGNSVSARAGHSEGEACVSSAISAHSEGNLTTASALAAHSEGEGSTASGRASHAEGSSCISSGVSAHTEGNSNTASADNSHAGGLSSTASAAGSFAHGYYAKAAIAGVFAHNSDSGTPGLGKSQQYQLTHYFTAASSTAVNWDIPIDTAECYSFRVNIVAVNTTSNEARTYTNQVMVKNISGTVSVTSGTDTQVGDTLTGFTVAFSASSTNLRVSITGSSVNAWRATCVLMAAEVAIS